jgi:hypothetical protein
MVLTMVIFYIPFVRHTYKRREAIFNALGSYVVGLNLNRILIIHVS